MLVWSPPMRLDRSALRVCALLALPVALAACGADTAEGDDFYDPPAPDDVAIPDGADPGLPPENDGADGALADDASVDAPVDAAGDVGGPEASVGAVVDARVDAAVDARVDAGVDVQRRDAAVDVPRRDAVVDAAPPRCVGSASGQSSIWTCTADRTARQRCVSGTVQTDRCAHGCEVHPSGTDDTCAPAPPALPACARQALLAWGLHPTASDHLRCLGVASWRITQTIGNAAASAGTHARDGYVNGQPYSAATDLSVRGLSAADIRTLLSRLASHGFAAWYRWPGHDGWPSSESPHIHAIFVGAFMKDSLRAQVRDWLVGRNGLASHTTYTFTTWTAAQRALVRALFDRYN